MKILHVETGRHFYGGPQQVVYLLEGLRARGAENVLVCPPGSGIGARARGTAARVIHVDCAGDPDLGFAWRLSRVLRRETPDVMHCHSRRGADFPGGLAAALSGVPAVVSRRVDHREPALLARLRYRPFRKVIAISANVAAVLRANGLGDDRLTVIRSAVDFAGFQHPEPRSTLRAALGLEDAQFAIAAVGQLIPRKGHRYLLEAMATVTRQAPRARLIVFGQGRLESALKAQAASLNLGDAVRFAGFRDDLDRYMPAFDLLVHPAMREGLGVAMLKAAAAGKAVVAFDVAGPREAVLDRKTGLLARPGDAGALAEAMLTLAGNETLRRAYGEAGRQRVRTEFSIGTMVDRHMELYESLLDDRGHAG